MNYVSFSYSQESFLCIILFLLLIRIILYLQEQVVTFCKHKVLCILLTETMYNKIFVSIIQDDV